MVGDHRQDRALVDAEPVVGDPALFGIDPAVLHRHVAPAEARVEAVDKAVAPVDSLTVQGVERQRFVMMAYAGQNFDIVTGTLAIPVALLAAFNRAPLALIRVWNLLGLALLLNVVIVAVASLPVFAAFGPDRLNTWVADAPFVWLPGVLVPAALFGHVLTFRRLRGRVTA